MELLAAMVKDGKEGTPEFAELKRRLGWEFNGMRLHELYFREPGGRRRYGQGPQPHEEKGGAVRLGGCLRQGFQGHRQPCGASAGSICTRISNPACSLTSGSMNTMWGTPPGCNPILVLDVFEHAFITDYGLKRADYIEAFFKNVKWDVVEKRLR